MDFFFPFEVDKNKIKNDYEVAKKLITLSNQKRKASPNHFEWENILGTLENAKQGQSCWDFF